jgi:glutamyl-tRNA reductase
MVNTGARADPSLVTASTSSFELELPPTFHVMCIGISIHDSNVSIREQVAIKMDEWVSAAQQLILFSQGVIVEAAVLSTCNRFELYLTCEHSRTAESEAYVMRWLQGRSGLNETTLRDNLFVLKHDDAVKHLLRVSAGLDSLVVGEGQILSQVSACHQAATGNGGQGGKILSRLLNQAVQSGKRVRDKTGLARGAVSISSAAIEFAAERASTDLRKLLTESTIAVVGAGTMARLLLVHLKSRGVRRVVVCSLNIGEGSRAAALADEFGGDMDIGIRPLSEVYDVISNHDISFFATAATEPIVTRAGLVGARDAAQRSSPLVLVDICVPRNVEQEVDNVVGAFSYNIDRLKDVVARNTEARREEVIKAEIMLQDDVKQWLTWHISLAAVPTLKRLRDQGELVRQQELKRHSGEVSQLSEKQQDKLKKFTEGLVKGLMHQPMVQLNKPQKANEKQHTIEEFHRLFGLYEGREANRKDEAVKLLELIGDVQEDSRGEQLAASETIENLEYGIRQATVQALEDRPELSMSIRNMSSAENQDVRSAAEDAVGTVAKLHERAEIIRQQKLSKQKKYLKSLTQAEAKLVEKVSRGIVNNLMAGPTSHLMSAQPVNEKIRTLKSFASLFRVPTPALAISKERP